MNITGLELQYNVSPLLVTPRTAALLFAGAASYVGFVDVKARNTFTKTEHKLQHWTGMYQNSLPIMGGLSILGAVLGGLCYWKSKQKFWLIGGALMGSLWPYTLLTLMPINKELVALNEQVRGGKELSTEEEETVTKKISSWVNRHRGRIAISVAAAVAFYAAELYSTHDFSVTISRK